MTLHDLSVEEKMMGWGGGGRGGVGWGGVLEILEGAIPSAEKIRHFFRGGKLSKCWRGEK